jgi:hypothetical protein
MVQLPRRWSDLHLGRARAFTGDSARVHHWGRVHEVTSLPHLRVPDSRGVGSVSHCDAHSLNALASGQPSDGFSWPCCSSSFTCT